MRIGIVCYPTYGGSGVVATELGKNLAQMGLEVHFISYALPYRLSKYGENVFFHEVKVPKYPLFEYPPYALALATKLADIAIHEKLDLIHAHYAIPHAISAYLAREMIKDEYDLKVVTTLHGTDITLVGADPSFMGITRYSINRSDAVTTVSQYLRSETIKTFQPKVPIKVIYNFITDIKNPQNYCQKLKKELSPNGEPILVHLSNFRPVKRVLDTLHIGQRVLKSMPIRLVLIGDGPDRALAEKTARELGIEKSVTFMGKQDEVYSLLELGDIFLMPSSNESFGLAALEAMYCGLPCVTSNAGGLTEVNKYGLSGYYAPVGDVDKMSEYVVRLLKNDSLRQEMSQNARQYAMERFGADKIVLEYIELYEELLGNSELAYVEDNSDGRMSDK